jgi:uncharacterized protein
MSESLPHRELPASLDSEFATETPWKPDDADGRTLFDTPTSNDGTVTVVFPQERFAKWRSQALAKIVSREDGRVYLAQVVKGPYAAPVGLPASTPALVITQVEGSLFTPPYHGWASLEILGEIRDGQTLVPLHRPRPNSSVNLLTPEETRVALNCDGDLRLGNAVGYENLPVGLRSDEKAHLPRHTLAVGTTGAGKSTFLAGWVAKLAAANVCVILIDVEGEYSTMHQPANSPRILPALAARGLAPAGVPNSFLLVPTHSQPSDPTHPRIRRFCLEFANTPPDIAAEILGGNEAQTDRFLAAYEAASELFTQLNLATNKEQHAEQVRNWEDEIAPHYLHADGFREHAKPLIEKASQVKKKLGHAASWRKTVRLIAGLYRTGLFDRSGTAADGKAIDQLDYAKMLAPGRVLIVDLAGVESPAHRNLAIADLLRGVNAAQDVLYDAAPVNAKPKTVIVIEEAHEFVSGDRIAKMPTLFQQITRIARRGRKRWLGLTFATQFPQHLPSELFTLCNTRILLRLGDEPTVRRLQNSVGGVPENLWSRLKNLPTGQAIVSAHGIEPAMLVNLEPGCSKLRMVD